jgi:hypothetical protein
MLKNRGFVKNIPNFFGVRTGFVVIFGDAMTAPSVLRTFWLGIVGGDDTHYADCLHLYLKSG